MEHCQKSCMYIILKPSSKQTPNLNNEQNSFFSVTSKKKNTWLIASKKWVRKKINMLIFFVELCFSMYTGFDLCFSIIASMSLKMNLPAV